jgi:hypothetical protein
MSGKPLLAAAAVAHCGSVWCALASRDPSLTGLHAVMAAHDFGAVGQGEELRCTFTLKNYGPEAVRIVTVSDSCDCTTSDVSPKIIPSGETANVTLTWETRSSRGRQSTTAVVAWMPDTAERASAAAFEYTPLTLSGDVMPDYRYEPEMLVFRAGEASKATIRFLPGRLPDVELIDAYASQRAFQVAILEDHSAVEVSYDPAQWPDDIQSAALTLVTSSPRAARCEVPITVVDY